MERSYDLCWMCLSRLDEPGVAFDIPEAIAPHDVVLCRACYDHPKRDQIAQRLESFEQLLRMHTPPGSIHPS